MRELERKIGSLCRAVAVQIAEDNKIMDETTKNSAVSFWRQKKIRKKHSLFFLQITNMKIKLEDRDKAAISSNPPKMPKVLDVSAVQEILGVSTYQVISILPITFYKLIWRKNPTKWANHDCILLVPHLRKHDKCPIGAKRRSSRFGMDFGRRTSHGRRGYENERRRRISVDGTIGRRHERVRNFGIILDSIKFQKGTVTQT